MDTQEIANRLAAYCRKGEWEKAYTELFADDARSIEQYASPLFEKETIGLENMVAKARKFDGMIEKEHSLEVSEPLVAGNTIAFTITMDATMKDGGRMNFTELCLYQLKDGKIISEEFFYPES